MLLSAGTCGPAHMCAYSNDPSPHPTTPPTDPRLDHTPNTNSSAQTPQLFPSGSGHASHASNATKQLLPPGAQDSNSVGSDCVTATVHDQGQQPQQQVQKPNIIAVPGGMANPCIIHASNYQQKEAVVGGHPYA